MIHSYYYIKNYLNKKEIKLLNKTFKSFSKKFSLKANTVKTSTAVTMPPGNLTKIKNISSTISFINRESFGFDIYENVHDFVVQNTYSHKNKGQYKWHSDGEGYHKNYTIKLTTLLNLSEEKYEGGKFYLFEGGAPEHIKEFDEPGSLLCFPSFVNHKVEPVTKGTRISGTVFTTGRWWR